MQQAQDNPALCAKHCAPDLTTAADHVHLSVPALMLPSGFAPVLVSLLPLLRLGSEFMLPLDEGTLLYMPSALPGLSAGKAAQLP